MKMRFTSRGRFSHSQALLAAVAGVGLPLVMPARAAFGQLTIIYNSTGSAQTFTVPSTTTYDITAYGGQGGGDVFQASGGRGAFASGTGTLTAGDPIELDVGGAGAQNPGSKAIGGGGGGGGGASFVYDPDIDQLLVGAGGGGGANDGFTGGAGQAGGNGGNGGGAGAGAGGINGAGGSGAGATNNRPGGGGGTAFNTAGGNSTFGAFTSAGGGTFPNYTGGTSNDAVSGASGGYGGGGAGDYGGGGGGGFSGGGGSVGFGNGVGGAGGGGGSFVSASLSSPQFTAGQNIGNGQVAILVPTANLVFNNGASDNDFTGNISGAGAITIQGSGTVIYEGSNSYLGGTTISSGTLQIGNFNANGNLPGNVTDNAALAFTQNVTSTYGGVISGTGSVTYEDGNTTVLTGSNTYSGGTTLNGNLELGNGGTTGSINGNVNIIAGALGFARSNTYVFSGNISGSNGSVFQLGSGTTILTGADTAGSNTIVGGTLQIGDGGTSGSVSRGITDNGTLVYDRSDNVTATGPISGSGNLTQSGSGLLFIPNASNTYTGSTTINNGVIIDNVSNALPKGAALVTNGGFLGFNVAGLTQTVASLSGNSGGVGLSPNDILVVNQSTNTVYGGQIYDGNEFGQPTDTGQLIKQGAGTLTLTNSNNGFGGGTTISGGSLQIGNGSSGGSILATGNITDNANLTINLSSNITLSGAISGTGSLTQAGSGTTLVNGDDTYSGGTTISGGTLEVQFGGITSNFLGNVTDNANITFSDPSIGAAIFLNGSITGSGSLTQIGPGTTTLRTNCNYTGGTTISSGTLSLGSGGTTGLITGNVVDNATLFFNLTPGTFTFAGNISGSGAVIQGQNSTIILTGTNTYSGNTTIFSGSLQIGNGGASGSITGNIIDDTALVFDSTSSPNYPGVISGPGSVTIEGSGISISNTNTYTGPTTLMGTFTVETVTNALPAGTVLTTDGFLGVGTNDTQTVSFITGNTGGVDLQTNAILVVNVASGTDAYGGILYDGHIFGPSTDTGQLVKQGTGTLILTNTEEYGGTTTISAGTLQFGDGTNVGSLIGSVTDNASLIFDLPAGSTVLPGAITGTGSVLQKGPSTTILTGANNYSGGTTISAGTLQIGNGGAGSITGNITDNSTLAFDSSSVTYSGNISGTGGLVISGSGVVVFNGSNTYTGGTLLSGGILRIGSGGTSGFITGNVTDNANLNFDLSSNVTFPGNITGTGSITQLGSGTLILTGSNNYSGNASYIFGLTTFSGTIIRGGVLQVGNGGTLGNITANTIDNAALVFDRSDIVEYGGNIKGPGSVTQIGSGALTLFGSNSYTGGTNAVTGILIPGGTNSIPVNTALSIGATALVQLPPSSGPYTLSALNITTGGKIDLATNKLVINYGSAGNDPMPAIANELATGYNGGAWTGPGISSSAAAANMGQFAIGYLDGNTAGDDGAQNVAANQIVIAYTIAGDAFLEGSVGFDDLVVVAQNFGKTGEDWAGGNFDYDPNGSVGFSDLVSVAQNFGQTYAINSGSLGGGLSPVWQAGTTSVPEPGAVVLAIFAAGAVLARRRRV